MSRPNDSDDGLERGTHRIREHKCIDRNIEEKQNSNKQASRSYVRVRIANLSFLFIHIRILTIRKIENLAQCRRE
jgi:hypothetical protein